jgi:hypothetical protein
MREGPGIHKGDGKIEKDQKKKMLDKIAVAKKY